MIAQPEGQSMRSHGLMLRIDGVLHKRQAKNRGGICDLGEPPVTKTTGGWGSLHRLPSKRQPDARQSAWTIGQRQRIFLILPR